MPTIKSSFPILVPVLLLAALLFVYCGDSDESTTAPVDPLAGAALCLSDSSCVLSADCDTSIAVNVTNCGNSVALDWSAIKTAEWFSLSSEAGTTPGSFTVTADTNATSSERSGLIIIAADGLYDTPETLTVSQPLIGSDICLSTDVWTCAAEADTSLPVTVINCGNSSVFSWAAECDSFWLSMSPAGGDTPGEFVMMADSNRTSLERTATVTVAASGLTGVSATITVTQPTLEPTQCVSLTEWGALSLGGNSPVISVTNCGNVSSLNWEVAADVDWLTLSASSGSTPGSITITADTNNTGLFRTGYVLVTNAGVPGAASVITVNQPSVITLAGICDTPGGAVGVFVSGDYAYVADYYGGLQIVDISNPASPALAGSCGTSDIAVDVYVSGDYAYVADGWSGLQIVDVSNPSSPVPVGNYNTPGDARGVSVSGNYAYVADGSSLIVFDISDPSNPDSVGGYDTPGYARNVFVTGDYAYVADGSSGLMIVDISNPASPGLAGSYDTPNSANDAVVSGDQAYVADWGEGLQIIDISNPSSTTLTGSYNTPGTAKGVFVSGDHAFVADGWGGLWIVDISDPSSPALTGSYDTPQGASDIYVSGDYVFVANDTGGLLILELAADLTD